jgi:hypothetical protein
MYASTFSSSRRRGENLMFPLNRSEDAPQSRSERCGVVEILDRNRRRKSNSPEVDPKDSRYTDLLSVLKSR